MYVFHWLIYRVGSETPFVIKIFKTFSSTSVHYSISVSVVIRRSNNMTSKGRIAQTSVKHPPIIKTGRKKLPGTSPPWPRPQLCPGPSWVLKAALGPWPFASFQQILDLRR